MIPAPAPAPAKSAPAEKFITHTTIMYMTYLPLLYLNLVFVMCCVGWLIARTLSTGCGIITCSVGTCLASRCSVVDIRNTNSALDDTGAVWGELLKIYSRRGTNIVRSVFWVMLNINRDAIAFESMGDAVRADQTECHYWRWRRVLGSALNFPCGGIFSRCRHV